MGAIQSGPGPRPAFSELRMAQLMAARGARSAECCWLAPPGRSLAVGSRTAGSMSSISLWSLLEPGHGRRLAEAYYRRLDRAERTALKSEEGAT